MNVPLFIVILLVLQLICLYASRRASHTLKGENDYFLAGKEVLFFPLLMSFIATQVGGGLILGSAEEAYRFGWSVLLYPMGASLGFIVLALGIGKRMAQFEVSTVAQLFERVYSSSALKIAGSLLSIVSLFLILIAQVIASRKFMASLAVDSLPLFLVFWSIVILYTVMGGLKALVSIDIIQALFFIIVFTIGFGYVVYTSDTTLLSTLQAGWRGEEFELSSAKLLGWLFMPLLFMVIEQDMAQRCFAARSPGVVTRAAGWAGVATLLICLIPVYFGVYAKQVGLPLLGEGAVFMTVAETMTSPTLSAFLGCAVLMALISTAISLINAVSSNLMQDFDWSFFPYGSRLVLWKSITALIGLLAVFLSFYYQNIVDLLIESYELSVYCMFVPIVAGLFKPQGNKQSAILAMLFGGVGFLWTRSWEFDFPKELLSVLLSLGGFTLGEGIRWIRHPGAASNVSVQ